MEYNTLKSLAKTELHCHLDGALSLSVIRDLAELANTDNRTVSDTNLTKECKLFVNHFNTSLVDFYSHNQDAVQASSTSDHEKTILLERLKQAYQPYLEL